jgi:hypothetical protein
MALFTKLGVGGQGLFKLAPKKGPPRYGSPMRYIRSGGGGRPVITLYKIKVNKRIIKDR